ncbi:MULTISPECIES: STAS domain-containing protein [Aneurinibacillus]|jgi:anti-sigma B factor antagonist|uniref:Anti-sigma factor antagonist n=1 Tax=Aneurinibacillus danicus TaxID=267746 RepID=A0A511V235_9BACL|nr:MULTISPECIES: STAS domain-containing protein [Aneurinibacillus]GEN32980.1 anti-sigma-B factor antagonist [Aneurinibacillus danicus]
MNQLPFLVETEEKEKEICVYIHGDLDLASAPRLRETLLPLAEKDSRTLKVNLKNLHYMDSTGLGVFVAALKLRKIINGEMFLEEVPKKIQRIFQISGVDQYITIA